MDSSAYEPVDRQLFWQHPRVKDIVEVLAERLRSIARDLEKVGCGDERRLEELADQAHKVAGQMQYLSLHAEDPPTPYGLDHFTIQ